MNEEKIQDLLKYLASIGFKGPLLEQGIRDHIDIDALEFGARHEILWGDEKMEFILQLLKDDQFQSYRLANYRAIHTDADGTKNSQNFSATALGFCHTNLAYHIVSGRFADLMDKLSALNLGEFPGVDVHPNVEKMLSQNLNELTLKCSRNEAEGYVEYKIPVSKIDSWYCVDTYTATLTPYPDVEHGVFNGIHTKELESEMRRVNWHNDRELFMLHEDAEPELLPPTNDILHKILKLDEDAKGMFVADILKLKYWSDTSYFDSFIDQRTWDYSNALPKREQHFPVELEAKAAFNLLCGRAIWRNRVYPLPHDKPAWVRFDFTAKGPNGGYLTEVMPDFDDEKLMAILSALPGQEDELNRVEIALKRGDITPLELPNNKTILLEANPEQKTANIYSEDMHLIPVNFLFDPDWKPAEKSELNQDEFKRKPRQNIIQPDDPADKTNRFKTKR